LSTCQRAEGLVSSLGLKVAAVGGFELKMHELLLLRPSHHELFEPRVPRAKLFDEHGKSVGANLPDGGLPLLV